MTEEVELEALYQELLIDHYKNPRCRGECDDPDFSSTLHNPLCGDVVTICGCGSDAGLSMLRFSGKGCLISQAAASILSELCEGKSLAEISEILGIYRKVIKAELPATELEPYGDLIALAGVSDFAARIKCALLAADVIESLAVEARES